MAILDAALVGRWFDAVETPSTIPYLQIALTAQERRALDGGRAALLAALAGDPQDAPATLDEPAARWLAVYLDGLAAGVGGARAAEDGPPGVGTPLHLVAGLITGAAAVSGWDAGSLRQRSAVETAHRAGAGAAEEAVTGADLNAVAQTAAAAAVQGWVVSVDEADLAVPDQRVSALLARVLRGLGAACRPDGPTAPLPPDAAGWQAACADQPWNTSGEEFLAEITFRTVEDAETIGRLSDILEARGDWVGVWTGGESGGFHVHTNDAGRAITEIFSVLTPFDLTVARMNTDKD